MQYEIKTLLGGMSVRTARVLVVEDEFLHMEIMKKLLKKLGFEKIHECGDATTALKEINEHKVDLVLTDGNLPGMDGLSFVKHLREHFEREAYSVPIIMLTGNRETSYVMQAKTAGVDQFIAKPFNIQTLRERIEYAFEERRPVILADRDIVTQAAVKPA